MIQQWLNDLGPWSWFIIGLLLMLAELLLPGVFLIWFGISALVIGTLTLISFTDVAWWPWQAQIVAFGALSLVLALMGRRLFLSDTENDAALRINDPLSRHVGSEATMHQAIENGSGQVKLGDTVWRANSTTNMPKGAKVRVVGHEEGTLIVEAV